MPITSIDEFIQNSFLNTSQGGFLKPSRFEVEFENLPGFLGIAVNGGLHAVQKMFRYNVVSVGLPDFRITETDQNPLRHRIVQRETDNISMTFFESTDLKIRQIFFVWMQSMVEHTDDVRNFQREFFNDSVATLKVYALDPSGKRTGRFDSFTGVFPTSAGNLQYDIGDENTIAKIPITFKYRYHLIEEQLITET